MVPGGDGQRSAGEGGAGGGVSSCYTCAAIGGPASSARGVQAGVNVRRQRSAATSGALGRARIMVAVG